MEYVYAWLLLIFSGTMATMVPGAAFTMVLRNSISISRQAGILTAGGLAAGLAIHSSFVLLGVSLIIANNVILMRGIQCVGALYLAYVGFTCLRSKKQTVFSFEEESEKKSSAGFKTFSQGFITNLANPKVIIFSLSLFSQFITPSMPVAVSLLFATTLIAIEFIWFSIVAMLLTQPKVLSMFALKTHWIERISGCVLLAIALGLIVAQSFIGK